MTTETNASETPQNTPDPGLGYTLTQEQQDSVHALGQATLGMSQQQRADVLVAFRRLIDVVFPNDAQRGDVDFLFRAAGDYSDGPVR